MSLFRFLLILAALYLVWRFLRAQGAPPPPAEKPYLPMARCSQCGAHVPQDALSQKGLCGRCSESAS